MSNRYSKTGFTQREIDTLENLSSKIEIIYNRRIGKDDSEQALIRLLRAREQIRSAIVISNEWKKDEKL